MTTRHRLSVVARVVVTVTLLAVVVRSLDVATLVDTAGRFRPSWVVVALALQFLGVAASTLAWRSLLAPFEGRKRGFGSLFRLYLVSRFFTLVGPGTVVGDATRVYQTQREAETRRDALATPTAAVVAEKALYAGALVAVASVASLAVDLPASALEGLRLAGAVLLVGAIGAFAGAVVVDRVPTSGVTTAGRAVVSGYVDRPGSFVAAAAASLGTVAATVLSTWALVVALDLTVPVAYLWATVPLVAVLVALPISVQGLGVREGAYVFLLGYVGVPPEAALAISVTNFGLSLVVAAVGATLYLSGRREVTAA
ncbi:Lysylphosphatidylglycerol synthase TM region [Halogranum amylolyticum]|uniref:Lysylphosphatidylglycerol synthase TM region n=1 Tax=Halogranum amylolyticum TaxID=660520 RepID=A0A1H8WSH9_9EURY|nr:lysylphosphatidylglycerol synthase transmembrane domain-containing protein [Halogranum amylolyticum]SEP30569.1 Lysylphosphatidylglycerol synthase TM region [Halogranum amylolyticum]